MKPIILSIAVAMASQLAAQTAPEIPPMTLEDCTQIKSHLADLSVALPAVSVDADGWCAFEQTTWRNPVTIGFAYESLRLRGIGLAEFPAQLTLPASFELEITDVVPLPNMSGQTYGYVLYEQQVGRGFNVTLHAYWDNLSTAYLLDDLRIRFPDHDSIYVAARLENVDLALPITSPKFIETVSLHYVSVDIASQQLFETMLLPMMVDHHGAQTDPEAQIRDLVDDIKAGIASLTLSSESHANLRNMLDDIPHPRGHLLVEVRPRSLLGDLLSAWQLGRSGIESFADSTLLRLLDPEVTYTPMSLE